jgi:Tol biopolymer transport system component/DNA-binding SARP family transcriptional activator
VLEIRALGRLHVVDEGGHVTGAAAQPRRLALLALLATAGEQGITRDKLLAYFWPDAEEDRARRGLNQALYALRQDLRSDDVFLGSRDVRLNPDLITSDVGEFSRALGLGRLEQATERYAGPFLDGFHLPGAPEFERWAEMERGALARCYAESLEKLARGAAARGDLVGAVAWWRKVAAQDPLNARVAVSLMHALVTAGDRNAALQHARVYEVLLQEELDAPPDREVVALAERLRREPPEAVPAAIKAPEARPAPVAAPPLPVAGPPAPVAVSPIPGPEQLAPASLPVPGSTPQRFSSAQIAVAASLLLLVGTLGALLLGSRTTGTLAAGRTSRLTFDPGLELDPAISPDGKEIAYAADTGGGMQLYVRQLGEGNAIPISTGVSGYVRWPRWSPEGTRIAFQAGGVIYVVPALGGTPRSLVSPARGRWVGYLAWSPDGRELAYVESDTVYLRSVDAGPSRPLPTPPGPHSLSWSPDGEALALVSGNAAFVFGARPQSSSVNIGNAAPSSIWVLPVRSGPAIRITDDANLNTSPVWGAGGRELLFVSDRDGSRDVYRVPLSANRVPAGPVQRLTTGLDAHTITLSKDGKRLAVAVFRQTANIYSLDIPRAGSAAAAEARPLTSGSQAVEGVALSPDGRWLAFDSDRNGNQDVFKMPVEGGAAVPLTTYRGDDFMSSWSPDGSKIAYYSYRDGTRRVVVMSADGEGGREVGRTPAGQRYPGWSPEGDQLVFHSDASGRSELYVVAGRAGSSWGRPRRLTNNGGQNGRWSPDGRWIAYTWDGSVRLIAPEGGTPRVLVPAPPDSADAEGAETLIWAPDGRTLYYKAFDAQGQSSIWSVPASGGPPRLLLRFDDAHQSNRPEFATDGRRLFFTMSARSGDIWSVELVGRH